MTFFGYRQKITSKPNIVMNRTKGILLERAEIRRRKCNSKDDKGNENFFLKKMYISVTRFLTKYKLLLAYMYINNDC